MKPILFLSVLLVLTACASNSAVGTSRSGFIAQCTSRFNSRANTALRSRYSAREWQRVTSAYDRGQSNPVLERQMSAAANSCVRRYPVR